MKLRHSALALTAALIFATPAGAGSEIEIMRPWARPSMPARPGATYLGIHNLLGDTADRLVAAHSERAGSVEIHQSAQVNGVMTMTPVESVALPADGMAHPVPGGPHPMMFGIAPPPAEGESFPLVPVFEFAGEITVEVPVSKSAGQDHQHGQGQGGGHQHGTPGN